MNTDDPGITAGLAALATESNEAAARIETEQAAWPPVE
jgi:hypothetical protein